MRQLHRVGVVIAGMLLAVFYTVAPGQAADQEVPVQQVSQEISVQQPVQAATDDQDVLVCGFYKDVWTAWYSHCDTTCIFIWVDHYPAGSGGPDGWKKIPTYGTYDIGGAGDIHNAWYDHVC